MSETPMAPESEVTPKPKPAPKKATTADPAAKKTAPAVKRSKSAPAASAPKNGAAKAKPAASPKATPKTAPKAETPKAEPESPVDRAEVKLDEFGKVVGGFFVAVSRRLSKAAAVAREEMEDLWAEAQSIRRGDTK